MGHPMFFLAAVAACLLWSAAFIAAAVRTDRVWVRRILVATAVVVPPLVLVKACPLGHLAERPAALEFLRAEPARGLRVRAAPLPRGSPSRTRPSAAVESLRDAPAVLRGPLGSIGGTSQRGGAEIR
ncbi:MAG: hypothetical protein ACKOZU_01540 [Planctomycetaceae bacterium]